VKAPRCRFGSLCAALTTVLATLVLASAPPRAAAQDMVLPGRVLRVTDGDTVRVRLDSGPINVRLHAVDTPELGQPWGREARDALARRLPAGRAVQLDVTDQSDGYGRVVARVLVDGIDLNAWLVRAGHGFVYRQYAGAEDRDLCRLEHQARLARDGLWGLPPQRRVAPWEWRRNKRGAPRPYTDWSRETAENCRANFRRTPDRMTTPDGGAFPVAAFTSAPPMSQAPRPGCDIKGNISGNGRIYHLPGGAYYARTRIDESRGERWFCSESEARAAGWRPAR
jgi:endonuclease YncB( thermonuclease family)